MKRTAIYIRVSTDEQAKHGYSIDAQKAALMDYLSKNEDLQLVGEYYDEGVSAHLPYKKRPALMQLLNDVQQGRIDLIAFIKLDRWFRSVKDYYQCQEILDKNHVDWIAITEDYNTLTSQGRLMLNLKLSIIQNEAEVTADRIKFVFDAKKERGEVVSGSVPIGVKIVDKHLAVDEETAPRVREIFQRYIDTGSRAGVAREMANKYGKPSTTCGVAYILSNTTYLDLGIIDEETFNRARTLQQQRSTRHTKSDRVYLFSGILRCPECGSVMRGTYTNTSRSNHYSCSKHHRLGNTACAYAKHINETRLEQYLIENIVSVINSQARVVAQAEKKVDVAAINRKIDKLKDLYINEFIDREEFQKRFAELKAQLPKEPVIRKDETIGSILSALEVYNSLDRNHRKAFWNRITESIIPTPDGYDINLLPYLKLPDGIYKLGNIPKEKKQRS